jgi:hypothetical protein
MPKPSIEKMNLHSKGLELTSEDREPPTRDFQEIWDEACQRGSDSQKEMIYSEGEPLTAAAVMSILSIQDWQLQELQAQGRILAVRWDNKFLYPSWQFNEKGEILPGLQSVITALNTYSSWEKLSFLLSRNARLKEDKTPLQELRDGNIEIVA